uniref:Calcineurin-like phosphoesterase domain-containing protein n=1 Tax=Alexandrium andersonii TaxID=327968 RepID=A0A7S2MZE4_9DINO
MWVHYGEHERYPDSLSKLHGLFAVCDELGVDVVADAIAEDLFIVPLHSWYNAEFDEQDPWPDPNDKMDSQCRWPMDPDDQVWKYMLKLNEGCLGLPFHGTVISFSHFLPRRELPLPELPGHKTSKSSGCERIDDLVRGVRSKLHVFGHSRQRYFAMHQGVTYVNQPLGYSTDQAGNDLLPMLMVYDGRTTCARTWDITTDRPH